MISDLQTKEGWYFIGIGGVSMSALARLMHDRGISVRGSDGKRSAVTDRLNAEGIPVSIGDGEFISEENIVYTGAIGEEHAQLKAAKEAGKRLFSRAELLGALAEEYPCVLSVSGCHGKTSTTSMLAHIFYEAGRPFTCHIGGEDIPLGNYYCSAQKGKGSFLTEACEFRRSFLSLKSTIAVVLNCDRDHTDCYKSGEELLAAYRAFAGQAKRVVVNADDVRAREIPHTLSFGFYCGDVRARKLHAERERYSFTVTERGIDMVRVHLNAVGKYQVKNALAAYCAARLCGFSASEIKRGLESFQGVKRRFEEVGTIGGIPVVCDYAHHPRELAVAFSAAQAITEGTVRVVFQPHTYTRTRDFMTEFLSVLKQTTSPLIYATYSAREAFFMEGSAVALVSRLPEAGYVQSPGQLKKRLLAECRAGDLILVLGAGDIYEITRSILD